MTGKARVVVVGGGVSGLTTAFCLQDRGFHVTLVAERFGSLAPSVVAGALWEYPPAVCGYYESQPQAFADEKRWSLASYRQFLELAENATPGIYLRPVTFYSHTPFADNLHDAKKLEELRHHVRGFRHDPDLIKENGISAQQDWVDSYTYVAPQLDMKVYLDWLEHSVLERGATKVCQRLSGSWPVVAAELRKDHQARVVIQATGLGAGELGDRDVVPVRGALLQVLNDGNRFPPLHSAHCTSLDALTKVGFFVFILPRGKDRLWLGGFAEPDTYDLSLSLDSSLVQTIHRRCVELMPRLSDAVLDPEEPLRVGLRPFRRGGVRVEADAETGTVHNYGHGGSGVLLSWGCARHAAEKVGEIANG